jgi:hypothetical protein
MTKLKGKITPFSTLYFQMINYFLQSRKMFLKFTKFLNDAPDLGSGNSTGWNKAISSSGESWTRIRGRSGDGKGTS